MAAHLDITPAYLGRLFQKECGIGLKEYIERCKVEKSREQFANSPHVSIKKVAASVGISNVNHFCKLFKKYTGLTPSRFRKDS